MTCGTSRWAVRPMPRDAPWRRMEAGRESRCVTLRVRRAVERPPVEVLSPRSFSTRWQPEVLGDHHPLYLVRALADLEDLLVSVEPGDRELVHEAVPAVDLDRRVDGPVREEPGEELRLRRRQCERPVGVLQPGSLVDEGAARLDLGRHVGELELDGLERADRPAELLPLERVGV